MHTDCNEEQSILVYPYFKGTLLSLIQEDPELPLTERRKVLRIVGEAIQELHRKDWIHIGAHLLYHQADDCQTDTFQNQYCYPPDRCQTRQHPRQLGLRRQWQQNSHGCNPRRF
jgi:hypothetical protein